MYGLIWNRGSMITALPRYTVYKIFREPVNF